MMVAAYTDNLDLSVLPDYDILKPHGRKKKGRKYYDCVCAFDIETTRIKSIEQSVLWIWQFSINNDLVIYGRTWEEYKGLLSVLSDRFDVAALVVYVHNLSYEFSFLKGIFEFDPDNIFAISTRRILKASHDNIEYRCSYIHSNMSLAKFCESVGSEYQKADPIDFTLERYYYTPVTQKELDYCLGDVISLVSAIRKELENDKDTLASIPLTSTGYIRRDIKNSISASRRSWARELAPTVEEYRLLRNAFRGGNTHANRFIVGRIIQGVEIKSYDRSSSYPDVQCNELFPVGRFYPCMVKTVEDLNDLIYRREKAVLFEAAFVNLRLKDDTYPVPYLSRDKVRGVINGVYDNGRVLCADTLEATFTDLDWKIFDYQYTFDDIIFGASYQARYGKLPACITEVIKRNYVFKTSLKGLGLQEYFYTKSKNKLNSVYGCSAQNPVHAPIVYDPDLKTLFEDNYDLEEVLAKNAPNMAMPYCFGVWTTAAARYELERAIRLVFETPGAIFLYCDTDSVKFVGDVDFTEYNNERVKKSTKNGAFAKDKDGNIHYMGVYEPEFLPEKNYSYEKFVTLGAKKYAYEAAGKFHLTISGVHKKKGAIEMGAIENFKPGFIFKEAGGTEAVYNDVPEVSEYTTPEGITIPITSNLVIRESTYTLNITPEFWDLVLEETGRYDPTLMISITD